MKSLVFGVLFIMITATASSSRASSSATASSNLRFQNPRIGEGIEFARRRSPAFRDLLAVIADSDLIVYIQDGGCVGLVLPSCVRLMRTPGARRVVIAIQPRETLRTMVRQLAHELGHASEIAAYADVVDDPSLRRLYERIGFQNCGPASNECWETRAALDLESRVADETFAHARPTIDDSYFGVWTLNAAKSSFENTPALTSGTRVHRDQGFGLISIVSDIAADDDGHDRSAYVLRPDSHRYTTVPPDESPAAGIVMKAAGRDVEFVLSEGPEIAATGRQTLSRDGLTLVIMTRTVDGRPDPVVSTTVWEKQRADLTTTARRR